MGTEGCFIVNGVSKMAMIVCHFHLIGTYSSTDDLTQGEMIEKATRVLSEEDRLMMDQDFVGKNGEKRKIEVLS